MLLELTSAGTKDKRTSLFCYKSFFKQRHALQGSLGFVLLVLGPKLLLSGPLKGIPEFSHWGSRYDWAFARVLSRVSVDEEDLKSGHSTYTQELSDFRVSLLLIIKTTMQIFTMQFEKLYLNNHRLAGQCFRPVLALFSLKRGSHRAYLELAAAHSVLKPMLLLPQLPVHKSLVVDTKQQQPFLVLRVD